MKEAADLLYSGTVLGDTHTQVTSSSCYMGDLTIQSLLDHAELLVEEFIGHLEKTAKQICVTQSMKNYNALADYF